MLSVGAIHFEDGFCASKKGGIGGGGRVSARGAVHMAGALAGCRKALVGTGWTISHLVSTNRLRNHSPPLVGAPFLDLWAAFSQGGLTTESSLMSGCSWGHEPKEIVSKKL